MTCSWNDLFRSPCSAGPHWSSGVSSSAENAAPAPLKIIFIAPTGCEVVARRPCVRNTCSSMAHVVLIAPTHIRPLPVLLPTSRNGRRSVLLEAPHVSSMYPLCLRKSSRVAMVVDIASDDRDRTRREGRKRQKNSQESEEYR